MNILNNRIIGAIKANAIKWDFKSHIQNRPEV